MPGNSLGKQFKITTWGESHGPAIGAVIDGCPAGLKINLADIQKELDRRRPGQSKVSTPRKEADKVEVLSGIFEGKTTGTPISLIIWNKDQISKDYSEVKKAFRPGHADLTYALKYGIRDHRGGGRASARETATRVAGGAIAKQILKKAKVEILAYTRQVKDIKAKIDPNKVKLKQIEENIIRCPDKKAAKQMIELIEQTKKEGDSVGGIIECVIKNVPPGLGSPIFEKLEANLAQAMLSIPAAKGFEIGDGFASVLLKGSEHNDPLQVKGKKVVSSSNHAGGTLGGISSGQNIIFRVAFKPTSSIFKKQKTVSANFKNTTIKLSGRHDPCILPRAVPVVEAMAALVLADEYLIQKKAKN